MIYIKNQAEIDIIYQGGQILARILDKLGQELKPGASTAQIEDLALSLIKEAGGRPAFKDYNMGGGIFFPSALCVSINNEVVHGSSLPDRLCRKGI